MTTQQNTAERVFIPSPNDYDQLAAMIEAANIRREKHNAWVAFHAPLSSNNWEL